MQAQKGAGEREKRLAACREKAKPGVRACIQQRNKGVAASKAPPAPPKSDDFRASAKGKTAPGGLLAPPRGIADITAVLDKEKPEVARFAKWQAQASAQPPKTKSARTLAQFYYDRGYALAFLGREREALADGLKALEVGKGRIDAHQTARLRQFVRIQHLAIGNRKKALEITLLSLREVEQAGLRGLTINILRSISGILVSMGDVEKAEDYARRVIALVQEARGSPGPRWREAYARVGDSWEADADVSRALIFRARGQLREAEAAYVRAEAFRRASVKGKYKYKAPTEQILLAADTTLMALANIKARQGRLSEAEADARRALLGVLRNRGKYSSATPHFILGLAHILAEQGRYDEAERLIRSAIDIQKRTGMTNRTVQKAEALSQLGQVLALQQKAGEAAEVFGDLDVLVASWEPEKREAFQLNDTRIAMLYKVGQVEAGIAAARELVKRQSEHRETQRSSLAVARGTLAIGLALAGRDAEAVGEFRAAIPVLEAAWREDASSEDFGIIAARGRHLQAIAEAYMRLLARMPDRAAEVASEAFALADAIRGRSVQRALSAASARMSAKDAALVELVRSEQDLTKQVNAQLGMLNNALSLASDERDSDLVGTIKAGIERQRLDLEKARREIQRRFPSYADLMDPKPASLETIRAALRPDEALLSFYFGEENGFVWALSRQGAVQFATVPMAAGRLAEAVHKLRQALEPDVETVAEIPPFDLRLAHELYAALLEPVEDGWKSAKSLIVVTNGALGLLPLSLLPTSLSPIGEDGRRFEGYRNVAWLARTHAVTMLPSATALTTLRTLPAGSASRDKLVAFGDPVFSDSPASASPAAAQVAMRGGALALQRRSVPRVQRVERAQLATLPPLPDTAEELRSVAAALGADPTKALHLGRNASEKVVKAMDLARFKVLAFATHGLLPGELDGLTQPALALSAPESADADSDGLLTMEEILSLRLDADWVVLSACNTGSGAESGAEATSGLGRAFFYAGARALLVTNWPVHSASARELVSEVFRRQSEDPSLSRSQALRAAMLALVDGAGFKDQASGETLYSYAHPLFWAPYTLVGDAR